MQVQLLTTEGSREVDMYLDNKFVNTYDVKDVEHLKSQLEMENKNLEVEIVYND